MENFGSLPVGDDGLLLFAENRWRDSASKNQQNIPGLITGTPHQCSARALGLIITPRWNTGLEKITTLS